MKSVVLEKRNTIAVKEKEEPQVLNNNDVKIKVTLTGICGTDLRIYMNSFPAKKGITLGHEAIGIVTDIGTNVTTLKVGDRVLLDPTLFCEKCYFCNKGQHNLCNNKTGTETGVDKDGTFAEFIVMPEKFVYLLPDEIPDERAVLIEPLACVLNNFEAASIKFDDDVLIIGGGPIGTIFAMLSEKYALSTTIVENKEERLRFIRQNLKNTRVIDGSKADCFSKLEKKPSVIVDATGVMLEKAIENIQKGGTIVAMGFNSEYKATIKPLYITNNAIKIIGAGDYNNMFVRAIDVAHGIELEKLLTHIFSLDDAQKAFELLTSSKGNDELVMKVAFRLH